MPLPNDKGRFSDPLAPIAHWNRLETTRQSTVSPGRGRAQRRAGLDHVEDLGPGLPEARAAVVAGEEDDRVLLQVECPQLGQDRADAVVHRAQGRRVGPAALLVAERREAAEVLLGGLDRHVLARLGQVEEEGPVLVALDEPDRLLVQHVGQVAAESRRPARSGRSGRWIRRPCTGRSPRRQNPWRTGSTGRSDVRAPPWSD